MKVIKRYNQPGKYELILPFEKEGEEKELLVTVDGRRKGEYELAVVAEHKARQTRGRVTVKAVAGVGAVVKLYGLIKIEREARGADDFLELRVLTLGETARGVAEPTLEILANEVKAGHAASVGAIDREQLVYLMSRGMKTTDAIAEIIKGFLLY